MPPSAQAQLKSYDSTKKDFWANPPPDWFLGDETEEQKGLAPQPGQPLPTSDGGSREEPARRSSCRRASRSRCGRSGVPQARQMAWGDKGTLFVGSFGNGNVYAVTDQGGKKEVKTVITGLKHADRRRLPGRRALRHRHRQAPQVRQPRSQSRQDAGAARSSTTTCRPTCRTAGNTWSLDKDGLALRPVRPAVQRLPAADQPVAVSPRQSGRPAWPSSWRSACATASAATSIRAPATTGSPRTRATG